MSNTTAWTKMATKNNQTYKKKTCCYFLLVAILLLSINVAIATKFPIKPQMAMAQLGNSDDSSFFNDNSSRGFSSGGYSTQFGTDNSGAFQWQQEQQQPQFLVYSDPLLGFRISYPADSLVEKAQTFNGVVFSIPGPGVASVGVFKTGGSQLADIIKSTMSTAKENNPDLKITKLSPTVISGLPGAYVIYTSTNETGDETTVLGDYVIAGDRAYHIMFFTSTSGSASEPFVQTVKTMLKSFEITETSASSPEQNQGSSTDNENTGTVPGATQ